FFFFSSRRRHTRFSRDWSSDVCSSDLFDPYSFSTAPRNTGSHGTHTMGTMVGDDGGSNQVGVAPSARWVACIGFGGAGGGATDAGLIACNQWMVAPTDLTGNNPNPALDRK